MREKLEKYAMIKYIEDKTELSFIAWLNNQLNNIVKQEEKR